MFNTSTFRQHFPEFGDESKYPTPELEFEASIAEKLLNQCRWGNLYEQGIELYVAHAAAIDAKNKRAAAVGAIPGANGVQQSKAVGSVSTSYDTQVASEQGAGYYNLTVYGQKFWRLMRLIGAGGLQI